MAKMSGVYCIRHLASGKAYIGSSVDLRRREKEHRTLLRGARHHSPALQNAWTKYGEEAFEFFTLEEVADHQRLVPREQFHIDLWKPQYNPNPTAGSQLGTKHTPESLAKMRAAKLGKASVKRADPTRCANGEHAWVDGATECRACANAAQNASRLARLGRPKIDRSDVMTDEVRAKISATAKARGIAPKTQERADPTKCLKGLHAWVEGQKKCRECAADTYNEWALRTGRATGAGRWPRA